MMYFYEVHTGVYDDLEITVLYHDKHFSQEEFSDMYFSVVEESDELLSYSVKVAELLRDKYGFEIVETIAEEGVEHPPHKSKAEREEEERKWFTPNDYHGFRKRFSKGEKTD